MTRRLVAVALALACVIATTPASARHQKQKQTNSQVTQFCGERYCANAESSPVKVQRWAGKRRSPRDANANAARRTPASNIFLRYVARGVATTSRECLTGDTRAVLEAAERHFARRFVLASTCRPGATIARTGKPSWHRDGRAADVEVPRGVSKAALARWFYDHASGLTMTYRNMSHVHFDTGTYHRLVRGADAFGGRRNVRRHYQRHAQR